MFSYMNIFVDFFCLFLWWSDGGGGGMSNRNFIGVAMLQALDSISEEAGIGSKETEATNKKAEKLQTGT